MHTKKNRGTLSFGKKEKERKHKNNNTGRDIEKGHHIQKTKKEKMIPVIKIGIGFGDILFGSKMEEVRCCLGNPEQISNNGESPNNVIAWHYWSRDYSIYFDESENYVFSSASVDNCRAILFGKNIFNCGLNNMKKLFQRNGYTDFLEEKDEDGSIDLTVWDAACVAFFHNKGKLNSFSWFTFTDDDTNETIWPDLPKE
ncbi:MAG: hypothetical protein CR997_00210 [Acidobacteria bacterium]|nr:MAG: hypothetical protein CR997_00210 [Acidobacteriota bacterium]